MAATYDAGTDAGNVRLLIGDRPNASFEAILEDEDITALLALRGGDVFLAAASALRSIAADTALRDKVIRLQDIQTDGAALARELRMQADRLESQANEDFDLGWAPMVNDAFSWRTRVTNERLTDG